MDEKDIGQLSDAQQIAYKFYLSRGLSPDKAFYMAEGTPRLEQVIPSPKVEQDNNGTAS